MCGIVGVIGFEGRISKFFDLITKHSKRGDSAHGFITNNLLYKKLGEFNFLPYLSDNTEYILSHIRAPTEGSSNVISNTHPFETKNFWLAHNGIIHNWKKIANEWTLHIDMDSKLIVALIQSLYESEGSSKGNVVDCIKWTAQKLEGSFACWLLDKQTNEIYLFRCISPIKYTDTFFSSEIGDKELDEGKIFNFTKKEIVGTFEYYTPYDFSELKEG